MVLVTGGSGCGKSAYAEKRIREIAAAGHETIYYLATMQVFGEEGRKKVERHVELRRGKGMLTIEQTRDVADAIPKMTANSKVVILEDLGNLVANEMFPENGSMLTWETVSDKILAQIRQIDHGVSALVIVSNNVFEDGIDYEDGTRNYIRALGRLHQELAREAGEVVEVVAGIPLTVKGSKTR